MILKYISKIKFNGNNINNNNKENNMKKENEI